MKRTRLKEEYTVVIVKPDGVKKGIIGVVVSRLERAGLKLAASKLIWVNKTHAGKHYRDDKDYHRSVGKKTLENYQKYGFDAGEKLGTKDPVKIGELVRKWNMEFLSSGPVMVMLWTGSSAIAIVRKLAGYSFPADASPGTIRGDFALDSAYEANLKKQSAHNIVHASGDKKEAEMERKLWFKEGEIYPY